MPQTDHDRRAGGERRALVRTRPAETTGGLAAIATAIAALAGASTTLVAVIGTAAGALPIAVTYLVNHGGISGVVRALWRGRTT